MSCRVFIALISLVWCFCFEVSGQTNAIRSYSMDGCDLNDSTGSPGGIVFGPTCGCGVRSNGLSFAGGSDFAEFDPSLNDILRGDWSMSLYIQLPVQGTESMDILFLGERCGLDSLLSLRFLPGSRRFRFILSDSPNNEIQVDALADDNSCWQYLAITKRGANVSIYLNGLLADQDAATSDLALNVNAALTISDSPCQSLVTNADIPMTGVIDELRIFDRPLTQREIQDANIQPDKIIVADTTIFIGSSVRLVTGGTCSSDFAWTPETYLDDPNQIEPISTPTEDITYTLTVNGDNCTSVDQITVRVADPSQLTCESLVLPTAFTPNDDLINDRYGISNQFLITSLESFEIFNRWGGRVFFTNEVAGSWDGNYKGEPAPPSAYVYKVVYNCDSQSFTKTGSVNLIR